MTWVVMGGGRRERTIAHRRMARTNFPQLPNLIITNNEYLNQLSVGNGVSINPIGFTFIKRTLDHSTLANAYENETSMNTNQILIFKKWVQERSKEFRDAMRFGFNVSFETRKCLMIKCNWLRFHPGCYG